jgi:hypothetical protein
VTGLDSGAGPDALGDTLVSGKIGVRAYVSKARAHKQIAHLRSLFPAVLQQQRAAGVQMARRAAHDVLDCLQAARSGDERQRRFILADHRIEVRVALGDVRRIGDDDVEALVDDRGEPVAM